MPELPEVTTTVSKLQKLLPTQKIVSVWTSYNSKHHTGKKNIKNPKYFRHFKKEIIGKRIKNVERIGKNILIDLTGSKTVLIHMKMTGHLLYGEYRKVKDEWRAITKGPLQDPLNGHIRLVFELSNSKKLVLSDVRKFAKVSLLEDNDVSKLGPDPLKINFKTFKDRILLLSNRRIKSVLMNQEIMAGVGNIYSDEALWLTGIHPETPAKKIGGENLKLLLKNIKKVLKKGIDFGGDSTSDYRQPDGSPGNFQNKHRVYRKKGEKCSKRGCDGTIIRKVVGGRSAHFCDKHQKKM